MQGSSATPSTEKRLGFALCGLGGLSTEQIAPALQKTRHCRLAGIVTDSPEKAADWRARYDLPARSVYSYDTMHQMADNPDIDVVYVVTPNALHLDHTMSAARAGKHVLCEKPMEISVERCQRMIDACRAADRQLGIAYRCQFEPHNLECMRIARERELGAVRVVEAAFGVNVGDAGQWRLKRALSGGGALMDVGIYALQATRYLIGEEPVQVTAVETRTDPVKFAEVDETVAWTAKFPGGAVAYCMTSFSVGGIARFRATGERGWFELEPAFYYDGVRGRRSDNKPLSFPNVDQFAAQMDAFAVSAMGGPRFRAPGEEGLRDVAIMQAVYESLRTSRTIDLPVGS